MESFEFNENIVNYLISQYKSSNQEIKERLFLENLTERSLLFNKMIELQSDLKHITEEKIILQEKVLELEKVIIEDSEENISLKNKIETLKSFINNIQEEANKM